MGYTAVMILLAVAIGSALDSVKEFHERARKNPAPRSPPSRLWDWPEM
jgi:hypothetical protein